MNVLLHDHEVYPLSGIIILVRMISNLPHVTSGQMEYYLLEKDIPFCLQLKRISDNQFCADRICVPSG